jgi:hypothetical protein
VTFQGNGVNAVYIDWDNDLLAVVRWIDSNRSLDQFLGQVIAAMPRSDARPVRGARGAPARPEH